MPDAISLEQLNRATLARQLLLAREPLAPAAAVERLGGLQAQEARPPFVALWTRLEGFRREQLRAALERRELIRATMMRATLHLMSAADYTALRATLQPQLTAAMDGILRQRGAVDVEGVAAAARELLAERPRTFNELRPLLADAFPGAEVRALGYAARMQVPLAMVPSEDRWSFPADAAFTPAEPWLGVERLGPPAPEALVRRHLGAFGPASAVDVQAWSGLARLGPVLDGMSDELMAFKHGRRTLYDLPDAPRPDPGVPAPPRFLPEFDSLLLAHKDRGRIVDEEHRRALVTKNLRVKATFLVEGRVAGSWSTERKRGAVTLTVEPFAPLPAPVAEELAAEGEALLAFLDEDAPARRVEFAQR